MERHSCTLKEHLLRRGRDFSSAEALGVAVQLAEAVHHLLSHGMVRSFSHSNHPQYYTNSAALKTR
jgi:hypothetical protein